MGGDLAGNACLPLLLPLHTQNRATVLGQIDWSNVVVEMAGQWKLVSVEHLVSCVRM